MALDFPSSPTTGQAFTGAGNTWTWDGAKWSTSPGGNVASAGSPTSGQWAQWTDASHITGVATASMPFVETAGDTMTGALNINYASPGLALSKTASGQGCYLSGYTGSLARWLMVMGDSAAESGSNAGSNFQLFSCDDAGSLHATAMTITRSTGEMKLTANLTMEANYPQLILQKTAAGQAALISGRTGSLVRWLMHLGDSAAETGSNAGSDFQIQNYNDAGAVLSTPLKITRSTGATTLTTLQVNGSATVNGGFVTNFTTAGGYSLTVSGYQNSAPNYLSKIWTCNPNWAEVSCYVQHYSPNWVRIRWQMSSVYFEFDGNGTAFKPAGGSWIDNSDARIKNVVGNYGHGLAEIKQLNPVIFTYKGNDTADFPSNNLDSMSNPTSVTVSQPNVQAPYHNSSHYRMAVDGKQCIGIVAQDAEPIMPELVTRSMGFIDGQKVDDMRVLDPSALTFALINAVKELSAKIETLAGRVAQLEAA